MPCMWSICSKVRCFNPLSEAQAGHVSNVHCRSWSQAKLSTFWHFKVAHWSCHLLTAPCSFYIPTSSLLINMLGLSGLRRIVCWIYVFSICVNLLGALLCMLKGFMLLPMDSAACSSEICREQPSEQNMYHRTQLWSHFSHKWLWLHDKRVPKWTYIGGMSFKVGKCVCGLVCVACTQCSLSRFRPSQTIGLYNSITLLFNIFS